MPGIKYYTGNYDYPHKMLLGNDRALDFLEALPFKDGLTTLCADLPRTKFFVPQKSTKDYQNSFEKECIAELKSQNNQMSQYLQGDLMGGALPKLFILQVLDSRGYTGYELNTKLVSISFYDDKKTFSSIGVNYNKTSGLWAISILKNSMSNKSKCDCLIILSPGLPTPADNRISECQNSDDLIKKLNSFINNRDIVELFSFKDMIDDKFELNYKFAEKVEEKINNKNNYRLKTLIPGLVSIVAAPVSFILLSGVLGLVTLSAATLAGVILLIASYTKQLDIRNGSNVPKERDMIINDDGQNSIQSLPSDSSSSEQESKTPSNGSFSSEDDSNSSNGLSNK